MKRGYAIPEWFKLFGIAIVVVGLALRLRTTLVIILHGVMGIRLNGHPPFVRPLIFPMAAGAGRAQGPQPSGELPEERAEEIKAAAARKKGGVCMICAIALSWSAMANAVFSLDTVCVLTGLVLLVFAAMTFRDRGNPRRLATGGFWLVLGVIFVAGSLLPQTLHALLLWAMIKLL